MGHQVQVGVGKIPHFYYCLTEQYLEITEDVLL